MVIYDNLIENVMAIAISLIAIGLIFYWKRITNFCCPEFYSEGAEKYLQNAELAKKKQNFEQKLPENQKVVPKILQTVEVIKLKTVHVTEKGFEIE